MRHTAGMLVGLVLALPAAGQADADLYPLPRFTEEREAAALFFVKKHLPELAPLLEELKKNNRQQYERQVREIFQVTEMLAELMDEPLRHKLELEIWKTENRAHTIVARLSRMPAVADDDARRLEAQLQELARELVELEIQVLELKADQLQNELGEVKDELANLKDQRERHSRDRFDALMEKVRKMRKPG